MPKNKKQLRPTNICPDCLAHIRPVVVEQDRPQCPECTHSEPRNYWAEQAIDLYLSIVYDGIPSHQLGPELRHKTKVRKALKCTK